MSEFRKKFEKFLGKLDLDYYRRKYSVRILEMNLPVNIQALALIYDIYWKTKKFIDFEEFYKRYFKCYKDNIEAFRKKTTMCTDCFHRGLRARIYRTWASLLTQIQGGYVAESVFGKRHVEMSEELDRLGADIRIIYRRHKLNYQIKKEAKSGVVGRPKKGKKKLDGRYFSLKYCVIDKSIMDNPKKRNGEYKSAYKWFLQEKKKFGVKILSNGFTIFTSAKFKIKKKELDNS